jgi:hypothetical protein
VAIPPPRSRTEALGGDEGGVVVGTEVVDVPGVVVPTEGGVEGWLKTWELAPQADRRPSPPRLMPKARLLLAVRRLIHQKYALPSTAPKVQVITLDHCKRRCRGVTDHLDCDDAE